MLKKVLTVLLTAAAVLGGAEVLLRTMVTSKFMLLCSAMILAFLIQTALMNSQSMRRLPAALAAGAQAACIGVMLADGFFSTEFPGGGMAGLHAAAFCLVLAAELAGIGLAWATDRVMKLAHA